MSGLRGMDLVDAITEWSRRGTEELNEDDINAILRIQLAIDASDWSRVDIVTLSASDVAAIKRELHDVDAPDFTAWVIDEALAELGVQPVPGLPVVGAFAAGSSMSAEEADATSPGLGSDELGLGWSTPAPPSADTDVLLVPEPTDEGALALDLTDNHVDRVGQPGSDPLDVVEVENLAEPRIDESDDETTEPDEHDLDDELTEAEEPDLDDEDEEDDEDLDDEDDELEADEDEVIVVGGGAFAFASGSEADDEDRNDVAQPVDQGFFEQLERDTEGRASLGPIEFRQGPDPLGPTFLPPPRRKRSTVVGMAVLSVAAIVAFVFFGLRLVDSIDSAERDDEVADVETTDGERDADESATDTDTEDTEASGESADRTEADSSTSDADEDGPADDDGTEDDGGDEDVATGDDAVSSADPDREAGDDAGGRAAADEASDDAALPPAENTAVILTEDGEVVMIDLLLESSGDPELVFGGPDGTPASHIEQVDEGLAIVTVDGDIVIVDLDEPDDRTLVWEAEELGAAVAATDFEDRYIVLEATGSIALFDKGRPATERRLSRPWDASLGGTPPARELDRFRDLVPFVIGNGDVRMIVLSSEGDPVTSVWDGTTQPRAFNLEITEHGLLIGVGTGGIARYAWFADEPFSAVWDPFDGSRLPAIAYAAADDATAIVLNNGSVALIDETGSGPIIWDAEVADLRAVGVQLNPAEALLLLDGGTVLRIDPQGNTDSRGSIWDVTDEALSPAIEMLLLSR